jgi:two-component sensor histidine kinase
VRTPDRLTITVSDNGVGLPAGFDLDATKSLGLQIVRTLVLTELGGSLEIAPRPGGGTQVTVVLPLDEVPAGGDADFHVSDAPPAAAVAE